MSSISISRMNKSQLLDECQSRGIHADPKDTNEVLRKKIGKTATPVISRVLSKDPPSSIEEEDTNNTCDDGSEDYQIDPSKIIQFLTNRKKFTRASVSKFSDLINTEKIRLVEIFPLEKAKRHTKNILLDAFSNCSDTDSRMGLIKFFYTRCHGDIQKALHKEDIKVGWGADVFEAFVDEIIDTTVMFDDNRSSRDILITGCILIGGVFGMDIVRTHLPKFLPHVEIKKKTRVKEITDLRQQVMMLKSLISDQVVPVHTQH